jgi:hypothetical protein
LPDGTTDARWASAAKQAASRNRGLRAVVMVGLAAALAVGGGLAAEPEVAAAAQKKVVIVVGPTGSKTAAFKQAGNEVAQRAASYGANVVKIYSPNATWARVKKAAQGANILVYIGHGNGWPSPYGAFQKRTKNGMGLNKVAGAGNHNHVYYGEGIIAREIKLAPNAVVFLMRLCYASGNPEWGQKAPSESVAKQRVDNFGAGFLRTGAKVVLAETLGRADYALHGLFKTNRTMSEIFWSAPNAVKTFRIGFNSSRTPGTKALMDPNPRIKGRYWRSIIGDLSMPASAWR